MYADTKNPAVRLLPSLGGLSKVVFREESKEEGDIRHQAEVKWHQDARGTAPPDGEASLECKAHGFQPPEKSIAYPKEQMKEWGYPEYDPNYDNPDWLKEQWRREDEDPRENANFFLDQKDPEFWNNVARKPYSKTIIQSEEHWTGRRNMWLQQFGNVQELNNYREQVVEALECCTVETKRLVQPIMRYRIVEVFLMHALKESFERGIPFPQYLDSETNRGSLCYFRDRIDLEGDKGAEELFNEWDSRSIQQLVDDHVKESNKIKLHCGVTLTDPEEMRDRLTFAETRKKDGVLEWEKHNYKEALVSWRKGHEALCRIKAPDHDREAVKRLDEIRIALLKNLAQAAIKLGYYNEALNAAEMAIKIDDQDHKAWFRKACALEGLGRVDQIETCLAVIDSIAVGRPDRERIQKDTVAKREKVREIIERDGESHKRMLQRGLQKAIFSEARDSKVALDNGTTGPPRISHTIEVSSIDEGKRKKLTRDGAEDLLKDLDEVYSDPTLRKQISKLGRDVSDQGEFVCYLNRVALPYQKPILARWGFEPSAKGVMEMTRAIQDHTRGKEPDHKLRVQAEQTMRTLYGEFYDVARGDALRPEDRAKKPEKRPSAGDESDGEVGVQDLGEEACCQHWRERPTGRQQYLWELEMKEKDKAKKRQVATGSVSAKERKELWSLLGEAMNGKDKDKLREAIQRAIGAKFSAVTIRSAKNKLAMIGGNIDDL